MSNLKVGLKIALGFGSLIIITLIVGAIAWMGMSAVSVQSQRLNRETAPQVAVAVETERNVLGTMYAMRGYALSGDDAYWEQALKGLEATKKGLAQALDLAAKYPGLVKLKENTAKAKAKLEEYENLGRQTRTAEQDTDKIRLAMNEAAARLSKSIDDYFSHQRDSLRQDIADGAPSTALEERVLKLDLLEDIILLIGDIRTANFKGQALRDPKIIRDAMKLFEKIDEDAATIRPLNRNPNGIEMMRQAESAAGAYKLAMAAFLKDFEAMEKLSTLRAAAAQAARDAIQEISALGVSETQTVAAASDATLSRSSLSLLAGLLVASLLGLGVAVIIARAVTRPLFASVRFADEVAGGNLDGRLDVVQKDELGLLADSLRSMVANLKGRIHEADAKSREAEEQARKAQAAMAEAEEAQREAQAKTQAMIEAAARLQKVAEVTTSASEELSAQIEQSSRGAEQQAQRVAETATAMEEMNATVLEVAKNASQAAETSAKARVTAEEGAKLVNRVVDFIAGINENARQSLDDMGTLGKQAEGIGQILNVISDIADQTNLLALNAAIEAARAGEAGRGFAVVADEVRKLAEKTMTATKEVGEAIRGIQDGTRKNYDNVAKAVEGIGEATDLASQSGRSLGEIVGLVDASADQVRSIATASEQQSATSEEINRAVEQVSTISSETSQAMNQAAQAVTELAAQTLELKTLIEEMNGGNTRALTA